MLVTSLSSHQKHWTTHTSGKLSELNPEAGLSDLLLKVKVKFCEQKNKAK